MQRARTNDAGLDTHIIEQLEGPCLQRLHGFGQGVLDFHGLYYTRTVVLGVR